VTNFLTEFTLLQVATVKRKSQTQRGTANKSIQFMQASM
jgi:hypothetical protein